MTDKQWKAAWLKVAERFQGTDRPIYGLCHTFADTVGYWPKKFEEQMSRFGNGRYGGDSQFWFPVTGRDLSCTDENAGYHCEEIDSLRCLFACLFSNMTIKEFEEVCR